MRQQFDAHARVVDARYGARYINLGARGIADDQILFVFGQASGNDIRLANTGLLQNL